MIPLAAVLLLTTSAKAAPVRAQPVRLAPLKLLAAGAFNAAAPGLLESPDELAHFPRVEALAVRLDIVPEALAPATLHAAPLPMRAEGRAAIVAPDRVEEAAEPSAGTAEVRRRLAEVEESLGDLRPEDIASLAPGELAGRVRGVIAALQGTREIRAPGAAEGEDVAAFIQDEVLPLMRLSPTGRRAAEYLEAHPLPIVALESSARQYAPIGPDSRAVYDPVGGRIVVNRELLRGPGRREAAEAIAFTLVHELKHYRTWREVGDFAFVENEVEAAYVHTNYLNERLEADPEYERYIDSEGRRHLKAWASGEEQFLAYVGMKYQHQNSLFDDDPRVVLEHARGMLAFREDWLKNYSELAHEAAGMAESGSAERPSRAWKRHFGAKVKPESSLALARSFPSREDLARSRENAAAAVEFWSNTARVERSRRHYLAVLARLSEDIAPRPAARTSPRPRAGTGLRARLSAGLGRVAVEDAGSFSSGKRRYRLEDWRIGGALVAVRFGPLYFIEESAWQALDLGLRAALGPSAIRLRGLAASTVGDPAMRLYTLAAATLLLEAPLEGRRVVDAGAGDGILALIAAKRGAKRLELVEYDSGARAKAWAALELNGLQRDRDFGLHGGDLARPEEVARRLPRSRLPTVVISNIGTFYEDYYVTNLDALQLVRAIGGVERFMAGGYTTSAPHGGLAHLRDDERLLGLAGFTRERLASYGRHMRDLDGPSGRNNWFVQALTVVRSGAEDASLRVELGRAMGFHRGRLSTPLLHRRHALERPGS